MKKRYYYLALAAGSAVAFLSEYEPFRDAVRARVQAAMDDLVSRAQYEEAIRQTLRSIDRLPETKEAE